MVEVLCCVVVELLSMDSVFERRSYWASARLRWQQGYNFDEQTQAKRGAKTKLSFVRAESTLMVFAGIGGSTALLAHAL